MNTYFINVVDGYELGSITVDHGLNDNRFNTNIQIIGDGITKLYNEKKDKIEIKELMPHFINVAIGTMRGIIVAKTAGTSLAKYPLPMLDAQAVLHSMMANMQKREQ